MGEVGTDAPSWLERQSIISLETKSSKRGKQKRDARDITGLSADTLKRTYPHLVKKISAKRKGMMLGDALDIASGKAEQKTA